MNVITNQNGFTYIFALTVVIIMGIMLGMVGQSWKTVKQRELEEELIYRGDQVAEVINQGYLCKNKNSQQTQITENLNLWTINSPNGTILDDLVIGKEERCANGINKKFRLRPSAALDPKTNEQWQIITPVGDATRFSGVASDSMEEPMRKSFREIYDSKLLDDKKHYSEWVFTRELKQTLPQK